jgi:hypothetical protein
MLWLAVLLWNGLPALPASAEPGAALAWRTLAEWTFDQPGQSEGWRANSEIKEARVADGAWSGLTTGDDPILELSTLLSLPTAPWQAIEVRMQADYDGPAEFFWSNTTQTKYGGFSPTKVTPFRVVGDGQWHTYRVYPGWHPEGRIVRLRFDLHGGARFKVDWIRVLEPPAARPRPAARFDFSHGAEDWQPTGRGGLTATDRGLQVLTAAKEDLAFSPPLQVDALTDSFVAIRMAVERGSNARIGFLTEKDSGLHWLSFPILADGRERSYNVDMLAAAEWKGRVIGLALQPTDAVGARAWVRSLEATAEPQGPPQLAVTGFAPGEALPRAGLPLSLTARVANLGGQPVTLLPPQLELPPGVTVLSTPAADDLKTSFGYGDALSLTWRLQSARPLSNHAVLRVMAAGAPTVTAQAPLIITARLEVPRTGYVPEPQPVRGPYEVGVYYFPGWNTASRWQPLESFPERKPVLGWYREGSPEVADWHIKWAVEHGVTFFAYDWYWAQGARQLEHGLHDGFFHARYRHLLKFCLLWANHNPLGTHSQEDCLAVTRFWIENYFKRPEYFRIDGQPLVIIFSPYNLTTDLGSAGVRQAFAAMRAECRRAGLPGLRLAACVAGPNRAAEEGYDSITAYNWPGLGADSSAKRAPYASLIPGYRRLWEQLRDTSPLPLLTPVCGGWDSRPWHGESALVRTGRTPELFQTHLREARQFIETGPNRTNLLPAILIEAWNEWGEGSYLEPHQEFGFGYLDAIREVFADAPARHLDLTPTDAGLGPYDVPAEKIPEPNWTFDHSPEGWESTMQIGQVAARNGALTGLTVGNDPAFFGPPLQVRAASHGHAFLRLRLTHLRGGPFNDEAQLFWRTRRLPESEASSRHFAVAVDGQWHEYRLALAENRRWSGTVTRLRLDPCSHTDVRVELDCLRLEP